MNAETSSLIKASPSRRSQLLRFGAWGLAVLVALYALLCVLINWSGARALTQSVARAHAAGEAMDFASLLSKPEDSAKNFCAIEALDGLTEDGTADGVDPKLIAKYNAIVDMKWKSGRGHKTRPSPGEPSLGRTLDDGDYLSQWSAWFRDSMPVAVPAPRDNEASVLREAFVKAYPVLTSMAQAVDRRDAVFTPGLGAKGLPVNLFALPVPHYNCAQTLGRNLALHSQASVLLRDGAASCADIRAILHLGNACQREPTLIAFLVGLTLHAIAMQEVWSGLEARIYDKDQLATLQRAFLVVDFERTLLLAMRGELACAHGTLSNLTSKDLMSMIALDVPEGAIGLIHHGAPSGLWQFNHATLVDFELNSVILPLRNGGLMDLSKREPTSDAEVADITAHPILRFDGLMTKLVVPAFSNVFRKAVFGDVRRNQTLIAFALEQHYLQHQAYPATLDDLVPQFLAAIPTDLIDSKPMRFRRTTDGRFMLWSIGLDAKDDQGKIITKTEGGTGMFASDFKGDWPWRYAIESAVK